LWHDDKGEVKTKVWEPSRQSRTKKKVKDRAIPSRSGNISRIQTKSIGGKKKSRVNEFSRYKRAYTGKQKKTRPGK